MAELKRDSDNANPNLKAAQHASSVMSGKGYLALFEFIRPTIDSQDVYTLWVNFSETFQILTIADHQGGLAYYRLVPMFGFDKSRDLEALDRND